MLLPRATTTNIINIALLPPCCRTIVFSFVRPADAGRGHQRFLSAFHLNAAGRFTLGPSPSTCPSKPSLSTFTLCAIATFRFLPFPIIVFSASVASSAVVSALRRFVRATSSRYPAGGFPCLAFRRSPSAFPAGTDACSRSWSTVGLLKALSNSSSGVRKNSAGLKAFASALWRESVREARVRRRDGGNHAGKTERGRALRAPVLDEDGVLPRRLLLLPQEVQVLR